MNRTVASIFLMLISPVFTLVSALKSGDRRYIKWIIVLFTVMYASTWDIEGIGDGTRHWQNVYNYYVGLSFSQFFQDVADILLFKTNHNINEDLYIHVISYFVGGVLSLPALFFVAVAFVYGYFFAGSMVKVFDVFPTYRRSILFMGIAILFIMLLNIKSMNTVRTWTGFWILFYACISYYKEGNVKYLWFMFVPPLFHIGFFVMAIPAWLVAFVNNRKLLFSMMFFISFGTVIINPGQAVNQLSRLEVGEEKVEGYYQEEERTTEETLEAYSKNRWYMQYEKIGIINWTVAVIASLFIITGRYFRDMDNLEASLFSIGILTKALSNSTWFLFAVANRSDTIAMLFILAAVLLYWQRKYLDDGKVNFNMTEKIVMYGAFLTFIPYYIFLLANTLEYFSILMFAFPFLGWISEDMKITVREFIGFII